MSTATIPLRNRRGEVVAHATINADDEPLVAGRAWSLSAGYAGAKIGGKRVHMHRLLLGLTPGDGAIVDHINRDKLDNRRENLRVGDASLNAQNRVRPPGRASRFRGVSRQRDKWRATATIRGKQHFLGQFDREEDAAAAAAEFRSKHMPGSDEARRAA